MIPVFAALILLSLNPEENQPSATKEFPEYSCKLTLPSPEFKWVESDKIPKLLVAFQDEAGTSLIFTAQRIPDGAKLDEANIQSILDDYREDDSISIISGSTVTFREIPSYLFHFRDKKDNSITSNQFFIANGFLYSMQLEVGQDQSEQSNKLDKDQIFSAFEFIGTPKISKSSYRPPDLTTNSRSVNKIITTLVKFFIGIVGAIFAIGIWYRRRNYQQDDF